MIPKINAFIPVRIIFVWALVFTGIVIYSLAWFTLGTVIMSVIDTMIEQIPMDDQWLNIAQLVRQIILWHPIISIFGWILWGFLNSMRRDVTTWVR